MNTDKGGGTYCLDREATICRLVAWQMLAGLDVQWLRARWERRRVATPPVLRSHAT